MPTYTNSTISCSFTISEKNSSGNFTITADFYNSSSTTSVHNCYLSCNIISASATSGWQHITAGTIAPKSSVNNLSTTFTTGTTADGTVWCYLICGDGATKGNGGANAVSGYADPTPSMSTPTLSISPTTVTLGEAITIKLSGGSGYSVSSAPVTVNGSVVVDFKSYIGKSWKVPTSTFEQLLTTTTSLVATFQVKCTAASGYQGSGNTNKVEVTMNLPDTYHPETDIETEFIDPRNDALVADISKIKLTLNPHSVPEDSSATISSVVLSSIETASSLSVNDFTQSGYVWTSTTLPTLANQASYTFVLTFTLTDSRGVQSIYKTSTFTVTNFVPPKVVIDNLNRTTATSGGLSLTITGESKEKPTTVNKATLQIGNSDVIDITSVINDPKMTTRTETGYKLENYEISGLDAGSQYEVIFTYQDVTMASYGVGAYSYTKILSTLAVPLSLYDDHSRMAISFGEECADDYGEQCVINFAKDAFIRYMNDNEEVLLKVAEAFRQCPYNVGDIYITTLSTDPSTIWPNTSWEQLEDAFLYASGTHALGDTGGEETHTLTVDEIPSHVHNIQMWNEEVPRGTGDGKTVGSNYAEDKSNAGTFDSYSKGGDGAHNNMPPYLVVNMWKRIETTITYQFTVTDYGTYSYDGPSTWSTFVSSDKNPVLSGSDKVFKVVNHATYGNIIAIGRLVDNVATYDKYIYTAKTVVVKSTARITNDATYITETGDIEYDYIMTSSANEVDILYTTDTHLRWLNNAGSDYTYSPVFSLDNVADYKDKLWDNNIPAFLVDCGDWVHGNTNTETLRDAIIKHFNNCGTKGLTKYLAVTYGNHEWYSAVGDGATCNGYLSRVNNMTACNLLSSGSTVYKGYRAVKIGDKRIGVIGVGYPSPNGRDGTTSDTRTFDGYTFYDAQQTTELNPTSALYTQVQSIVDKMKASNFDYIIAITHMDKYADESFTADTRFNSRADFLIQNTDGIDLVIPGHYNYEIDSTYSYTDRGGNTGIIVQEAGASLHSFGRIKLKFDGTAPSSYLLKSQSDLEEI